MDTELREKWVKPSISKQQPVLPYLAWHWAINLTIVRHCAQGHSLVQYDMWHQGSHALSKLMKNVGGPTMSAAMLSFTIMSFQKFSLQPWGCRNCYSQLPSEETGRKKSLRTFPVLHSVLEHQTGPGGRVPELNQESSRGRRATVNSTDLWCSALSAPIFLSSTCCTDFLQGSLKAPKSFWCSEMLIQDPNTGRGEDEDDENGNDRWWRWRVTWW